MTLSYCGMLEIANVQNSKKKLITYTFYFLVDVKQNRDKLNVN